MPLSAESGGDNHYAMNGFLIKFQGRLLNMLHLEWITGLQTPFRMDV